jgi:F-type H+-transporting ATPase subunit gamma
MCGQFNDAIAQFAMAEAATLNGQGVTPYFWTAGERVRAAMEEENKIEQHFDFPSSNDAISDLMFPLVQHFSGLHEKEKVGMLFLYYNQLSRGGTYKPVALQVLPFDAAWSKKHKEASWPSRSFPVIGMEMNAFFEHLFQQHIFASIYKAFAQSLASENAARLAAMQAAEKNILELQEKLQGKFRETRQSAITAELLDIISGFESLDIT